MPASDGQACHRGGNRIASGEDPRRNPARSYPPVFPSRPIAGLSAMKPSIHREPAIRKCPGSTFHRCDLVLLGTFEHDQLVLLGNHCTVIIRAHVAAVFPPRIVDTKLAA